MLTFDNSIIFRVMYCRTVLYPHIVSFQRETGSGGGAVEEGGGGKGEGRGGSREERGKKNYIVMMLID